MENKNKRQKHGGRAAGTPNKITADLRGWLNTFLETERPRLLEDWNKLSPVQRITLFERLLKFVLPQLNSTELKTDLDKLSDEQLDTLLDEIKKINYDQGNKNEDD